MPHDIDTLKDLMDERDRRYQVKFDCSDEAVRLAKQVADSAGGRVSIVTLISIIGLIMAVAGYFK